MSILHAYTQTVADGTATSVVRLREFLKYDPETGKICWLVKRTNNATANVGDEAGGVDENGYRRIMFDGKKYRAHRLAFVFMGLPMPAQVDHINGNRADNRWCNLRAADALINARNAKRREGSATAVTGVGYSKQHNKWKVRINNCGVTEYLGLFSDRTAAIAARMARQRELGYSDRHGGALA